MGEVHPVERYPAWALQIVFTAAVLTGLYGVLLLAGLPGLPHTPVLAIHAFANALILLTAWNAFRNEDESGWLVSAIANLAPLGVGILDLLLAGQAAANLQPQNSSLLALAVPGVAGVLAFSLDRLRKKTADETAAEDEAVLARDDSEAETNDDGEPLTWRDEFQAYISVMLFYLGYFALVIGGLYFCFFWHDIVWRAVNDGVAVSTGDVLAALWKVVQGHWMVGARLLFGLVVVTTVGLVWTLLQEKFKRRSQRRDPSDPQIDARVDAAMRAVWDYANRPDRPAMIVPIYVVPTLFFVLWVGTMLGAAGVERFLALRLYQASHDASGGWSYFFGTGGSTFAAMVGTGALLFALWIAIVSVWPGAADAAVTQRYRRNRDAVSTNVEVLRCTLAKYFKQGGREPFDAREYLLARRHVFVHWVYVIAAVVVPVAAFFVWASLNSYTVISGDGLVRHSLLASDTTLAWHNVRSVEITCRPRKKGTPDVVWRVRTADGRTADLTDGGDIVDRVPSLLKVDAILRNQGTDFGPPIRPTRDSDSCLERAGAGVRDFPGFLHLMHRD